MRTRWRWAVWAAAAVALPGCFAGAQLTGYADSLTEETLQVSPGGRLVLDVDRGSVEVRTADADEVRIEARRAVSARSQAEAERLLADHRLEITQTDEVISVRARLGRRDRGWWDRAGRRLHAEYLVIVPRQFGVGIETRGGPIRVAALDGEVRAATSGGNIYLGRIRGPVYADTSGGSIELEGCEGDAEVETSGGNIHLGEVSGNVKADTSGGSIRIVRAAGSVDADTSGGNIVVEEVLGDVRAETSGGSITATLTRQPQGECRLSTSGGNVTVYLAPEVRLTVDADTSGGMVSTDYPLTTSGRFGSQSLRGDLNGGGPLLRLRTSGGNIRLRGLDTGDD